ncbi:hypothetical protein DFH08DRAFT_1071217 [Mycena albidolilacea]|uniref:Uncharacterized protein n=1 Tax=Mycena albidolilacea TaxID=1033008 RepID=A0AAD7AUY9_9AGAR|nr:hypothetical protein DFH08DRAFT_1071217 [Mycena albidolilacea]
MERLFTTCSSFVQRSRLIPLDSTSAAALPRMQFEPPILHLFNPGAQRLTGYVVSFYEAKFEGLLVYEAKRSFRVSSMTYAPLSDFLDRISANEGGGGGGAGGDETGAGRGADDGDGADGGMGTFSSKSEADKIAKIELVTELRWLARFDPAGSTSKLLVVALTLEREWGVEGHIETGSTSPLPARRTLASSTSSMSWRG